MIITSTDKETVYFPILNDSLEVVDIQDYDTCTVYLLKQGTDTIIEGTGTIEEDNTIAYEIDEIPYGRYTVELVLEQVEVEGEEEEVELRKSYWSVLHVKPNNLTRGG